jgi:hypothetical protein
MYFSKPSIARRAPGATFANSILADMDLSFVVPTGN